MYDDFLINFAMKIFYFRKMKNTEEVILQKSLDLFIEFGIRNVSIDTICNELRISKKTFYSYFKQKEELVDAILTYEEKINIEEMKKDSMIKMQLNHLSPF